MVLVLPLAASLSREAMEAAISAFQHAEPALQRCRRLLPDFWIRRLECFVREAAAALPGAEAQLRGRRAMDAATAAALQRQVEQARQEQMERVRSIDLSHCNRCDGCGRLALGLRRCSRCKQAQYCR